MFRKTKPFYNYHLLIVNQTTQDCILESQWPNIRVINSFSLGSPLSRNTAIYHATGDICLMADDDIVYETNFENTILEAYDRHTEADFISFEAVNELFQKQANYPKEGWHSKASLRSIFTWVITFKRTSFREKNIFFNHYFGVGSEFKGLTEIMFLRAAYEAQLRMYHINTTMVMHPEESSGRRMGSDQAFYARAAGAQRFYGDLSYIWLLKYILFALRHQHISKDDIMKKFNIGLKGIAKYKELEKLKLINRVVYES